MAALVQYKLNVDSLLDEVESFRIIPRNLRPTLLETNQLYVDILPVGFVKEWYKYYIADGALRYNGSRVSIEACVGV